MIDAISIELFQRIDFPFTHENPVSIFSSENVNLQ